MTYQGKLIKAVIKKPFIGLIFLTKFLQFFCVEKKDNKVSKIITKATGPFVNIANPKKIHGVMQIKFLLLASVLQNESKLTPIVAHKRESLTAALLQIITKGDKAKPKAPIKAALLLLLDF